MKSKTPTVQCPNCGGCGKVEIPESLLATYDYLAKKFPKNGATTSQIEHLVRATESVGRTAVNNRLERLVQLGLATRTQEGRAFRYKHITKRKHVKQSTDTSA